MTDSEGHSVLRSNQMHHKSRSSFSVGRSYRRSADCEICEKCKETDPKKMGEIRYCAGCKRYICVNCQEHAFSNSTLAICTRCYDHTRSRPINGHKPIPISHPYPADVRKEETVKIQFLDKDLQKVKIGKMETPKEKESKTEISMQSQSEEKQSSPTPSVGVIERFTLEIVKLRRIIGTTWIAGWREIPTTSLIEIDFIDGTKSSFAIEWSEFTQNALYSLMGVAYSVAEWTVDPGVDFAAHYKTTYEDGWRDHARSQKCSYLTFSNLDIQVYNLNDDLKDMLTRLEILEQSKGNSSSASRPKRSLVTE